MQLSWTEMIRIHNAIRVADMAGIQPAFASGAPAVYFETRNFGWIILKAPGRDGRRIYQY